MASLNVKCKASSGAMVWVNKSTGTELMKIDPTNGVTIGTLYDVSVNHTDAAYFTVDNDSTTGKIKISAAAGAADKTLTLTNTALTDNRTITFPDATGNVVLLKASQTTAGELKRADLTEDALARYQIELMKCRNANGTVMDATGGAGLFKITAGGWGSGTLVLTGEGANGNTKTDTFCTEFVLPPEYVAAEDVKVNVNCKYAGAGTVGTKTIDVECYEIGDDGTASADICATAARTITTSYADYTFTITDTDLLPGDRLMILVQGVIQETVSGGALTITVGSVEVQCDIKG